MFTLFHLFNSNEVDSTLTEQFLIYIKKYQETNEGQYLKKINLDKLKFYECHSMSDENGVLGAWNLLTPNTIYIKPLDKSKLKPGKDNYNNIITKYYIQEIIPTILHECYHKYQSIKFTPIIYSVLAFPIWRNIIIEKPAYEISDHAELWIINNFNVFQ